MSTGVDTNLGGAPRSFGFAPLLEAFFESLCSAAFGVSDSEPLEFLLFTRFPGRNAGLGRARSLL